MRLAQFAALIIQSSHLFSKILELKEVKELRELFADITVNPYWETHYRFDKDSPPSAKHFGQASVDTVLLNTVALLLFCYGKHMGQNFYTSRALKLLENITEDQLKGTALGAIMYPNEEDEVR